MKTIYKLRMTGRQYQSILEHLFPGDGLEAVTVALCGVSQRTNEELVQRVVTVHEVFNIPYGECLERKVDRVKWSTHTLQRVLPTALAKGLVVLKIHSHPTGISGFSDTDLVSDSELHESLSGWLQREFALVSAIVTPDGCITARAWEGIENPTVSNVETVLVAGEDIVIFRQNKHFAELDADHFQKRTEQAFGKGTTSLLSSLTVGVVGVSGTGSPVTEMLYRLGVGHLVLVDDDVVEAKNLGRIYNSTSADAEEREYKVNVMARAIENSGLPTKVTTITKDLFHAESIKQLAQCDIVFGCMDSVDGRDLLNKLAVYYLVPYLDIGVHLSADGSGGIDIASAAIHYMTPDGPTMLERKVYTSKRLSDSRLNRANPSAYAELKDEGYIEGIDEDRPAVISLNTVAASLAVNDLLARLHKYRWVPNADISVIRINLSDTDILYEAAPKVPSSLSKFVGLGDVEPLLRDVLVK